MYKNILDENVKNAGGLSNFVISLRKEIRFWKLAFVSLILLTLYLIFGANENSNEPLTTKQIKSLSKNIVGEIRVEGVIIDDIKRDRMLDEIYKSNHVKGLVVVINSGGGSATASEVLYSKIKKISEKIPTIAFIEGVGASGAYMTAVGANKIISINSGVIGSIGVVLPGYDLSVLAKNVGVSDFIVGTTKEKEAGMRVLGKPTEVEIADKRRLINAVFNVFKAIVIKERGFTAQEFEKVGNAKVFIGEEALNLKLIDALGTKDLAYQMINEKLKESGIKNLEVKEIEADQKVGQGFLSSMLSTFSKIISQIKQETNGHKIEAIMK